MSSTVLIHYGIDGQKWGHRHGPPYPLSRQQKKSLGLGDEKKTTADLSNEELRKYLDRIKLDKELSSLTTKQKKDGMEIVGKVLGSVGNTVVTSVLPAITKYAAKNLLDKIDPELGMLVTGEKPKSELQKAKEEYDLLKTKKDIADLNKQKSELQKAKDQRDLLEAQLDIEYLKKHQYPNKKGQDKNKDKKED